MVVNENYIIKMNFVMMTKGNIYFGGGKSRLISTSYSCIRFQSEWLPVNFLFFLPYLIIIPHNFGLRFWVIKSPPNGQFSYN